MKRLFSLSVAVFLLSTLTWAQTVVTTDCSSSNGTDTPMMHKANW